MMPGAAMDRVGAAADAVARFQHDDGEAGILQRIARRRGRRRPRR